MGLDITAYRQVQLVADAAVDADGYPTDESLHLLHINREFEGRADDLIDGGIYTEGTEAFAFGAGSYSGYNAWRNELAKLAGYPQTPGERPHHDHCTACWNGETGPFSELINFSDFEGVIGAQVSAKLARDFADFDERAKAHGETVQWFYERYQDWRKAFEMAADGGLVDFH